MVILAGAVDANEALKEKWRGFFTTPPFQYLLPGAFKPSNQEIWYLKKDLIPLAAQFAGITCAVWIIHDDKDDFVPVGNAANAQKMLTHAQSVYVTIIPGVPHFIPWEPCYGLVKAVLMGIKYGQ